MTPTTARLVALALGLPLFAWTLTAGATEVYKWKDAKGVTHYSDAPPPSAKVTRSTVKASTPKAVAVATAPAEDPQCVTARNNLGLLKGKGPVGMDSNKDGKPDAAMDDAERARQASLAQAGVDVYCKVAPAAPKA